MLPVIPAWLATAGKVAEAAAPFLGFAGSIFGSSQESKNVKATNETQLQIARENNSAQERMLEYNNKFNRMAALEMFNLENEYNSPANMRRLLEEGGFNPATMYNNGSAVAQSDASTPQAASSGITPSMPNLTPPPSTIGAMFGQFESLTRALGNLSNSSLAQAQKNRLSKLLGAEFDKMVADANNAQLENEWNKFKFDLDKINLKRKQEQEIQELISRVFKNYSDGGASHALVALHEAETRLSDSKFKMNEEQRPILLDNLRRIGRVYESEVEVNRSQKSLNEANASKTKSETRSVDILNKILPEKYANELATSYGDMIDKIMNAGSAHNRFELFNQLINFMERGELRNYLESQRERILKELNQ